MSITTTGKATLELELLESACKDAAQMFRYLRNELPGDHVDGVRLRRAQLQKHIDALDVAGSISSRVSAFLGLVRRKR